MAWLHGSTSPALAVTAALIIALPLAAAITPLSSWQNGIATHYGGAADGMSPDSPSFGTLAGSCGYGQMNKGKWPYWSVGALATSNQYYSAGPVNGCGQCFRIECLSTVDENKGTCSSDPALRTVTIMISDECPECASNHIDLQALTFNKMAPMIVGRINIRYRRVECTPPADMKLSIMDNRGAGGWIRLSVQETGGRGAVQAIQIRGSDSGSDNWEPMQNVWGAEWESSSQPSGSISFRILPDQGGEVTAFNVLNGSTTGMVPTRVQFTMHDPPSTGPQQEAASQEQVQAFSGPPDYDGGNSSTSNDADSNGNSTTSAPDSNNSSSSSGGSTGGGSSTNGGSTSTSSSSSSGSWPSSSSTSSSSPPGSGSSPSSSGEGNSHVLSDSAAVDAPLAAAVPGDARRLLRRLYRRLLR